MKNSLLSILVFCTLVNPLNAQIEKGDSEIRFLFFYSQVSDEYGTFGSGSLQVTYGRTITPKIQVGVGPRITTSGIGDDTETTLSGSAYVNYNFSPASKTVPYLAAEWYQQDFSPENGDFTDYSYINIGFGVRNFLTEYAALNSAISYGFSLNSEAEGGLLMIIAGLSFIF